MLAWACLAPTVPVQAGPTTFSGDVAPLLFAHCVTCHRPGGGSSTVLQTYVQVRAHARQIVQMTEARLMPPWQPDGEHGIFSGDRRLSTPQIAVFRQWLDDGLPEGDPARLPTPPTFTDDWQLGTPDLVLTMPAFTLRAGGPDMFRNFVVPVPGDQLRYVRAWEFRPGNARVVHHATMQVDGTGASARYDADDAAAGYEGLIAPSARAPDGFFLDWAPGHRPNVAVAGTAWPLPASSDLVMMLHLRPSGREEQVQASLALYFSDRQPDRVPVMVRLTRQDLDIPAGASAVRVTDRYTLPVDVDVHTVQPHAHYLARRMSVVATTPDGSTVPLLSVPDWDFNWQDVYHYAAPPRLPAGTTLAMTIEYDNTVANPRNPSSPPVGVGYGQQTSDEMAEIWFQVVPVRDAERVRLVESLHRKVLPEEITGREAMLRRDPRNVALHDDLALMRAELGDVAGVERAFRSVLALRPESPSAQFNVGMARLAQADVEGARRYFAAALAADPSHGLAHLQLGLLDRAAGDLGAAAAHLDRALAARPADADVLLASGVVAALRDAPADAERWIRGALMVRPGWPQAQAALASVLSTAASTSEAARREAVVRAEDAVSRTGRRNVAFLDILAGAHAAAGDLARAVRIGREALALAEATGLQPAADAIRVRVAAWERSIGP